MKLSKNKESDSKDLKELYKIGAKISKIPKESLVHLSPLGNLGPNQLNKQNARDSQHPSSQQQQQQLQQQEQHENQHQHQYQYQHQHQQHNDQILKEEEQKTQIVVIII